MSRSSDLRVNPAVITLQWKNEKFDKKTKKVLRETGWFYYDKSANEGEGGNVMVPMPLTFLWLESAQSFTGYNEKAEKGVYSNEILNNKVAIDKYGPQTLSVKCDGKTLVEGLYKDIKEKAKGFGAKFCIPVYAAMELNGEYQVVRFIMTGSSGSAWMNFFKGSNTDKEKAIVCFDKHEVTMKTGATYEEPVFKAIKASPEQLEAADRLVVDVDDFFDYILSNSNKPEEKATVKKTEAAGIQTDDDEEDHDVDSVVEDDLPF